MKERLIYIDQLKGVAILLVVIGHFIQLNTIESTDNQLFSTIYSFHMPLFMFISGYIAFKTISIKIFSNYPAFFQKKATALLVPFFVWPLLVDKLFFTTSFQLDFVKTLIDLLIDPRIGLWFLWYLFFLTIIYSLFLYISNKINSKLNIIVDGLILSLFLAVLVLLHILSPLEYIDSFIQYFVFFFIGVFIAKFERIKAIVLNVNFFSACLITFIILCGHYSFNDPNFHSAGIALIFKLILSLSAIVSLYYIFRNITLNPLTNKYLCFWGTYSIVIYATHIKFINLFSKFYVFPPMHIFLLAIISLGIAVITMTLCMAIYKIVELSPPLNFLLYGNKK